jgi:hypothetical protein
MIKIKFKMDIEIDYLKKIVYSDSGNVTTDINHLYIMKIHLMRYSYVVIEDKINPASYSSLKHRFLTRRPGLLITATLQKNPKHTTTHQRIERRRPRKAQTPTRAAAADGRVPEHR